MELRTGLGKINGSVSNLSLNNTLNTHNLARRESVSVASVLNSVPLNVLFRLASVVNKLDWQHLVSRIIDNVHQVSNNQIQWFLCRCAYKILMMICQN